MNSMNKIDILLATYNGGVFLEEQIQSLLSQSYTSWNLLIRDDGSSDQTVEIIKKYVKKYPEKIKFIQDTIQNSGPAGNFSILLQYSKSDYVMFCDQDDVWVSDKIENVYKKILRMENQFGKETPLLVHSDLFVTDKNLNIIAKSMFEFQNLNPLATNLNQLLVQNNVTGCTVIINKALVQKATPIPKEVIMHDWWLALVASALGEIGFINNSTIMYRQHSMNDTGAKSYSLSYFLKRIRDFNHTQKLVLKNFAQAKLFYENYAEELPNEAANQVVSYLSLLNQPFYQKIKTISKYKFYKQGTLRNIGFLTILINSKIAKAD
jgi:glycosyltransferase involved in cell wall biosynthesis